jgi:hypothetical protein
LVTFQASQPKSAYRHLFMRLQIPTTAEKETSQAGARSRAGGCTHFVKARNHAAAGARQKD